MPYLRVVCYGMIGTKQGLLGGYVSGQPQETTITNQQITALVPGANRGLGRRFAAQLVERGAKVYAAARRPETIDLPGVVPSSSTSPIPSPSPAPPVWPATSTY
jgi:hypothetical protein